MYRIIGGDGQEYGPVRASEIRQWIAEGRLNAQSRIREENGEWTTLGQLPEFAGPGRPTAGPATIGPVGALPSPGFPTGDQSAAREAALKRVKAPAIGLMVTGVLASLLSLSGLAVRVMAMTGHFRLEDHLRGLLPPGGDFGPLLDQANASLRQPSGLLFEIVGLIIFLLIIFGAMRMKNLRSFGLAIGVSILAMLPCQCCCLLGLPFGIWALVVLNKPEVKAHFS